MVQFMIVCALGMSFIATGCNSASMAGSSENKPPAAKPAQQSAVIKPTPQPIATLPPISPNSLPQNPIPLPQPTVSPVEVVGGQEVINNCAQCILRAKQLSAQLGFSAEVSRAKNEGFYKISPIRNLCDIHFVPDLNTTIREHDGQASSILQDQIAIYCPCNCGWIEEY